MLVSYKGFICNRCYAPIRYLRLKSKTKFWFDIDVLNGIRNHDMHYKRFERSVKETDQDNFKCVKFLLKKVTRKSFTLQKKLKKIRVTLKNSGEL